LSALNVEKLILHVVSLETGAASCFQVKGLSEEVEWQYCKGPKREFWRRVPYTNKNPTIYQRICRLKFGEVSFKGRDKHLGKVVLPDGREILAHAKYIGDCMRGVRFSPRRKPEPPIEAKLKLLARQVAALTGSGRTFNRLLAAYLKKRKAATPTLREEATSSSPT